MRAAGDAGGGVGAAVNSRQGDWFNPRTSIAGVDADTPVTGLADERIYDRAGFLLVDDDERRQLRQWLAEYGAHKVLVSVSQRRRELTTRYALVVCTLASTTVAIVEAFTGKH